MRIASLCVLFIFLSSVSLAQSEKLPDILKPDAESEAEAHRMGVSIFKLVPRNTFPNSLDPSLQYKDEGNPIGIRGGGSYFSFATGFHSYNKIPEIELQRGTLSTGFAGYDYGFLVDVGLRDLQDIETSPEAKFFLSYRPPLYKDDIRKERDDVRVRRVEEPAMTLRSSFPVIIGDTYLLRAISWDEADIAVAFRVLKIDDDGSATIVWKPLAKFPKPFFLFMPDEELRPQIGEVIAEEKLVGIEFTVKDNWVVYIKGSYANINSLHRALDSRGIRLRGETRQVR